MESGKEDIYLGYMIYEVKDLQNGQCAEGTAADLSILTGVKKSMINNLARKMWSIKNVINFGCCQKK